MEVGERLRELREREKFTQNKLAEWSGLSQTHIRHVELGQADITVGSLRLICDALGITLKDFFNVDEQPEEIIAATSSLTPKQKNLLVAFLKSL